MAKFSYFPFVRRMGAILTGQKVTIKSFSIFLILHKKPHSRFVNPIYKYSFNVVNIWPTTTLAYIILNSKFVSLSDDQILFGYDTAWQIGFRIKLFQSRYYIVKNPDLRNY